MALGAEGPSHATSRVEAPQGARTFAGLLHASKAIPRQPPHISALSGLTSFFLNDNPDLTNMQPLLDNAGLGVGDLVFLTGTSVSCADVAALQAKGVTVTSGCS